VGFSKSFSGVLMQDTRTRDLRCPAYAQGITTASGPQAVPVWPVLWLQRWQQLGILQSVVSFRGQKPKSKVVQMLNPHPCTLYKSETVEPISDTGWLLYEKPYYVRARGNLIAYSFGAASPLASITAILPICSTDRYVGLQGRAIHKCYAKAKTPAMPGFVYIGELKETLRAIVSPLSGIRSLLRRMYKTAIKKKSSSPYGVVSDMSSQWLEYRYGIMPLVYQASEMIAAFEQTSHKFTVVPVRSGVSATYLDKREMSVDVAQSIRAKCRVETRLVVKANVCLATAWRDPRLNLWGTSWTNVPSAVYELFPLSFVLDWFVNLGDWIQSVTPDPQLKVLRSTISITQKRIQEIQVKTWISPTGKLYGGSGQVQTRTEQLLTRYTDPTIPTLPILKGELLSLNHSLDALSLVTGAIGKFFKFF